MTRGGGFSGRFRPADDRRAEAARHWVEGGDWVTQGDLGLMVQGEVCNTAELRGELDLPAGTPLAETLLAGWRRWDQGLLPRLDGVFALALRESGRIVLYRDPSGLRSLYLHEGPAGEVSFGSDLNRLVRLQGVLPRLARSSLHEYLRFGDISAPRAIYEGVLAVEPGQMVCASAAGIQMPATSPAATSGLIPSSFAEAVDQLDEYLYRSVAKRLAGTQRPAAFLSGGVDSALICAIAARQRPDLTALTVGFDGHAFDESPVAARIAEHLGLRHEVLRFGRRECLQGLERFAADAEQPLADPAAVVTMLAFERCQERFDSVLDGTGADEAIGLMPPRHTRLAVAYASLLPWRLRSGLTTLLGSIPPLAGYTPIFDFEHPAETLIRWTGFARPEVEALCNEEVSFEQTRFYRTFSRYSRHAHFERYGALLDAMPCDRLSQATLITGLPVRYPFCDHTTNGFIRQLRADYRYLPGQPKRILRALLARYLPATICDAPKHGFDFPLRDFLVADGHALVRQYLSHEFWGARGVISPARVWQYATQFIAGDSRLTFRVWTLVQLGAWLREHE